MKTQRVSFLKAGLIDFSAIKDFIEPQIAKNSGSRDKAARTVLSFFMTVGSYKPDDDLPKLKKFEDALVEFKKGGEDSLPYQKAKEELLKLQNHSNELVQLKNPEDMLRCLKLAKEKLGAILTEIRRPAKGLEFQEIASKVINLPFVKKEKGLLDRYIMEHMRILFSKAGTGRFNSETIADEITYMELLLEEIEKGLRIVESVEEKVLADVAA
jgi:hypothetical protein